MQITSTPAIAALVADMLVAEGHPAMWFLAAGRVPTVSTTAPAAAILAALQAIYAVVH